MAIHATVVQQIDGSWLFTWAAGTPPYSVWLDGVIIEDGLATEEYTYNGSEYATTPPPLEILDDGDTAENETYPPIYVVQWYGILPAAAYVVEEYSGSSWVERHYRQESGLGVYSWTTAALADGATAQWRVRAMDVRGNKGTAISFSFEVVRNPAPPEVELDLDSVGDLVVSEA